VPNSALSLKEKLSSRDPEVRRALAGSLRGAAAPEEREALYTLLGDEDWRVRKTAAEVLSACSAAEHGASLIRFLYAGDNAGLRGSATEVLSSYGGKVVPVVLEHLRRTDDSDVRIALLQLLHYMGEAVPLEAMLPLVRDSNRNVAAAAVTCLGRCAGAAAYDKLAEFLESQDLWLAFHTVESLGELRDPRATELLMKRYGEGVLRKSILQSLGRIGDVRAVSFLTKAVAERKKIQLDALGALHCIHRGLERSGDSEAQQRLESEFRKNFNVERLDDLLHRGLQSDDPLEREITIEALGWLQDEKAVSHLIEALRDATLREAAQSALARIGGAALPVLVDVLVPTQASGLEGRAEDEDTEAAVIETLGLIASEEAVRPLSRQIMREEPEIRLAAVEALGRIESPLVWPELLAQFGDASPVVQASAVSGLLRVLGGKVSEEAIDALRQALRDDRPAVRANALNVYARLQGARAHEALVFASKDEAREVRQTAIERMGDLKDSAFFAVFVSALSDESGRVRGAAVRALAKLRSSEALEKLLSLLEDEDMWVRAEAIEALGEIGRGDERVAEALLGRFDSEEPPVQIAALKALGNVGTSAAVDAVFRAAEQSGGELRLAAIRALSAVPGEAARLWLEQCLRREGGDDDEARRSWKTVVVALEALFARSDAARALESLTALLLSPSDPLVLRKVIAGLAQLRASEALPLVLVFLDHEQCVEEVGMYLRALKDVSPDSVENAVRRLAPRAASLAERLLQEGAVRTGPTSRKAP
jgi:HEAT repeat protein